MATKKRKTTTRRSTSRKKRAEQRLPAGLGTLFAGLLLVGLAFVEGDSVWKTLHQVLFGLFGCGSFVLGAAVCCLAVLYTRGEDLLPHICKLVLGLVFASGTVIVFSDIQPQGLSAFQMVAACYQNGYQAWLSGGALGAVLGGNLLLLDEPTANLDPEGVKEVHDAVRHVLEQTRETLVVVEHHIDVWLDLVDRVIVLGKPEADSHVSGVIADGTPEEVFGSMASVLAKGGAWVPGRTIESHTPESSQSSGDVVLRTEDLSFGRDFALGEHVNLVFHAGEITALTGKNGVGKSTLALTLAGLLKPISGRVSMDETMVPARRENDVFTWKSRDLLGRIGMVFQEPEHQFVASSVRDEAAVGPKSMGKSEEESYAIADNMLERMNLARFAQANPFTLSGGEKRRLSVASMLAAAPKVLVMDEPTFGQDFTTWTEMVKLIAGARDAGCSVIMVTHDEPLIETLGARRVLVSEGE